MPYGYAVDVNLPIIHADKCCVDCKHFQVYTGEPGWSETTPGSAFTMQCMQQRFRYEEYGSEEHYRSCIISARRCTDFMSR